MKVFASTMALAAIVTLTACSGGEPGIEDIRAAFGSNARFMSQLGLWLDQQSAASSVTLDAADVLSSIIIEKKRCVTSSAGSFECDVRLAGVDCTKLMLKSSMTSCAKMEAADLPAVRFQQAEGKWQIVVPGETVASEPAAPDSTNTVIDEPTGEDVNDGE